MTSDPLGLGPSENPIAYPRNPTAWIDPLGLMPDTCKADAQASRNEAFREAKRDLGIPMSQQPDAVRMVPMEDKWGQRILGENGRPIITREYDFTGPGGQKYVIQDHSAGHKFGEGGVGDQGPHFNVRPGENPRTGHVPGTLDHYPFRP